MKFLGPLKIIGINFLLLGSMIICIEVLFQLNATYNLIKKPNKKIVPTFATSQNTHIPLISKKDLIKRYGKLDVPPEYSSEKIYNWKLLDFESVATEFSYEHGYSKNLWIRDFQDKFCIPSS